MKSRLILSAVFVAGLMSSTVAMAGDSTVVAIVDGKEITYGEVMKQKEILGKKLDGFPDDKIFPLLQNKIVYDLLIEKAAKDSKVAEKKEVKEALELLTQQIFVEAYMAEMTKDIITDSQVKKRYEDVVASLTGEKEAKLRQILVKDKSKADQIVKALKNKVPFKKLVAKSEDKATAKRGGEIGYVAKSTLPKEVAEKVFALKAGEYTAEPIKTEFGYHILIVDDFRDMKPPSYEESKDQLKNFMLEEARVQVMKDLRAKSDVKMFDKDGKALPEPEKDIQIEETTAK